MAWSKPGAAKESPMKTCWEVVRLDEQELTGPTFIPLIAIRRTTQFPQHDILTQSLFWCTSVKCCACYLVVELILWDYLAFALRAVWKKVQTLLGLGKAEKQTWEQQFICYDRLSKGTCCPDMWPIQDHDHRLGVKATHTHTHFKKLPPGIHIAQLRI